MSAIELMRMFISMGGDCEFGTTQKSCGAGCLDLLRWAGTDMRTVLRMLDDRFAFIADPTCLSVEYSAEDDEHWLENTHYGFRWHTWVKAGEMNVDRLMKRELARLKWQADRLIDELVAGRRILVRKAESEAEKKWLDEFVWLVRTFGPSDILFTTRSRAKAGVVERASATLLLGYLPDRADILANADVIAAEIAAWLPLCRQAFDMNRSRSGIIP